MKNKAEEGGDKTELGRLGCRGQAPKPGLAPVVDLPIGTYAMALGLSVGKWSPVTIES